MKIGIPLAAICAWEGLFSEQHSSDVSLDGCFAWPDDSLETHCSAAPPRAMVLTRFVLLDMEAEKVEANIAFVFSEGMRDAGFTGFQL